MKTEIKRSEDKSIVLTITLAWKTIQEEFEKVTVQAIENVEIKGFRKGKAPRELAEKELDRSKIYEEAIKRLMPHAYKEAVTTHKVMPIMEPDIKLVKAKEGEDWIIEITTAEKPAFSIQNYKELITKAKGSLKADELWIPGKEKPAVKEGEDQLQQKKQKMLSSILDSLLSGISITIPAVLIREDVARKLSGLIDQLTKLGLTIDSYCKSKGTTPDDLRKHYELESSNTYKLEFILEELAEAEKISVSDAEIETLIQKTTDQKEKESMRQNKYYLAGLLRRQKTLDRLISL